MGTTYGLCSLDQLCLEVAVGLVSFGGTVTSGALICARYQTSPRSQMVRGMEAAHIGANLSDNCLGNMQTNAGNGLQAGHQVVLVKRGQAVGNFLLKRGDTAVQVINVFKVQA